MAKNKWNFAIGTTSRVPGTGLHYLIADIDSHDLNSVEFKGITALFSRLDCNMIWQNTKHGYHVYTDHISSWNDILSLLKGRCDSKWLKIGRERGYLFLADKKIVHLPWAVERMVIHAKKKR